MTDPITQLRSVATQTSRNSPDRSLLDLNILPDRHRRRRIPITKVLPILLILALLGLINPAFRQLQGTQAELQSREAELTQVQGALAAYDPLVAELDSLQSRIDSARSRIRLIQESYANIEIETTRWSPFLEVILAHTPEGVILTDILQQEDQLVFSGLAPKHLLVFDMKDTLQASDEFEQVRIDFLARVPAETLSLSPTPDPETEEEPPLDYLNFQISLLLPEIMTGGRP